jgi:hypothetical protein
VLAVPAPFVDGEQRGDPRGQRLVSVDDHGDELGLGLRVERAAGAADAAERAVGEDFGGVRLELADDGDAPVVAGAVGHGRSSVSVQRSGWVPPSGWWSSVPPLHQRLQRVRSTQQPQGSRRRVASQRVQGAVTSRPSG